MSAEGGGLPHTFHLLPAFSLSPEIHSYAVSYSFLAMGLVLLAALFARITLSIAPRRVQNLLEWLIEIVEEQGRGIFGEKAARYMPFFVAVFLYILTCNLMGLIPGFMSPTASYHTNFAMAISVALLTQWAGIRIQGLKGYLKHFLPPPCPWWLMWTIMWWMWPMIHLLEQFIRPVSLTMRLFGNIYAKELLLMMLAFVSVLFLGHPQGFVKGLSVMPIMLRPAIILLGTLVSIVQAAVFTILSMVYVALAVEMHEEHDKAEAH